jgi:hypothetical protein
MGVKVREEGLMGVCGMIMFLDDNGVTFEDDITFVRW